MLNTLEAAASVVDFTTVDTGVLIATVTAGIVFGFGVQMLVIPIKKAYAMAKKAIKGV